MTEPTRALVITGPFEDSELELFAQLMRSIERSKPDQTFSMAIGDVEGQGIVQALELVARVFPQREKPN